MNSSCKGLLPSSIEIVLIVNDGYEKTTTGLLPLGNLTLTNGVYWIEWNFNIERNMKYQILVVSHSIFSQAVSNPFLFSE